MSKPTVGQLTELFTQIKSERITRERLDRLLKENAGDARERTIRALLKQTREANWYINDEFRRSEIIADIIRFSGKMGDFAPCNEFAHYLKGEGSHIDEIKIALVETEALKEQSQLKTGYLSMGRSHMLANEISSPFGKIRAYTAIALARGLIGCEIQWADVLMKELSETGTYTKNRASLIIAAAEAELGDLTNLKTFIARTDISSNERDEGLLFYIKNIAKTNTVYLPQNLEDLLQRITHPWELIQALAAVAEKAVLPTNYIDRCRLLARNFGCDPNLARPPWNALGWALIFGLTRSKDDFNNALELANLVGANNYNEVLSFLAIKQAESGSAIDIKIARKIVTSVYDAYWKAKALLDIARIMIEQKSAE